MSAALSRAWNGCRRDLRPNRQGRVPEPPRKPPTVGRGLFPTAEGLGIAIRFENFSCRSRRFGAGGWKREQLAGLVKALEAFDGDEAVDGVEQRTQFGGQVEISLLVPGLWPNLEDDGDHSNTFSLSAPRRFGRSLRCAEKLKPPKRACLISTEAAAQVTGRRKVRSSLKMKRRSCAKRKLAAPSRSALSRAR